MAGNEYPMGLDLLRRGACPKEATNPLACWFCPCGHATECHYPLSCGDANCSHSGSVEEDEEN